jgi:hypothetical protein
MNYEIDSASMVSAPQCGSRVEGGGFSKYQPLSFNKQPKYFTMEDMVKAIEHDIIYE